MEKLSGEGVPHLNLTDVCVADMHLANKSIIELKPCCDQRDRIGPVDYWPFLQSTSFVYARVCCCFHKKILYAGQNYHF